MEGWKSIFDSIYVQQMIDNEEWDDLFEVIGEQFTKQELIEFTKFMIKLGIFPEVMLQLIQLSFDIYGVYLKEYNLSTSYGVKELITSSILPKPFSFLPQNIRKYNVGDSMDSLTDTWIKLKMSGEITFPHILKEIDLLCVEAKIVKTTYNLYKEDLKNLFKGY